MKALNERIELLHTTDTITDRAKIVCEKIIEQFVNEDNQEKYVMLITHLAMAVTRIDRNEELTSPPEMIMDEIRRSTCFPQAQFNIAWVESILNGSLPKEEQDFLLMHFVNVLN
ncbi:PRD domain-containing protein [Peribacillus muralis]|uniref:PRD domain-containing protein n=1 Tax=Peribacillus muralis TaxID=264697 RepID=UPI00366EA7C0